MFDFVRNHKRIMQFLLVLLIFPSFVMFGVEGYSKFVDKGAVVASINGTDITQPEWDKAHGIEAERFRAQAPGIDPKLLDTPQARYGTLERMVRDRVMQEAAKMQMLTTSDQRLALELMQNPTIASLRKPDGSIDKERYSQLLGAQGLTPEMFEANVRADLANRQVLAAVSDSAVASKVLGDVALNAFFEQREIQVAKFLAADQLAKLKPTDEQLGAYYNAHSALFKSLERADIEYVVLDLAAIEKSIKLNDQDVKTYFEQNQAQSTLNAERRASHILVAAGKDESTQARAKAKQKAQELLTQLQKAPGQFADVAKKNSQDPGSASKGGDLDYMARGAMVKPFEDAVFALEKGQLSSVVETEFGYHIIVLTDIKTPKAQNFEQARPGLEALLRTQEARKKFAEAAEQFTNTVFEQPDSLKPAAEKWKLPIGTAQQLTRNPQPGSKSPLANPKLLAALFSPDTIEKKRNTEAVEVGPNQLMSARVLKHQPEQTLPLADVKAQVAELWKAEEAVKLAKQQALEKLTAWKAGEPDVGLAGPVVVSREKTQALPADVVEAVLRANTQTLPVWLQMPMAGQGHIVVKLSKVMPRDKADEAKERKDERQQLSRWAAGAEAIAYYNDLKERLKVSIKVPEPRAQ